MISVATSSLSALPSTIRDSFSRNTSDNEQSKETSDESKKQIESKPLENKPASSTSSRSDDLNVSSAPEPPRTSSTVVPPNEYQQQKADVDGSPPTTWLDNLAGSRPPTTNLDTTTITTATNASNSPASLNIEQFDFKDNEIGTPTVEDNISQIPLVNPPTDQNTTQNHPPNTSYEINIGRRAFRLHTKKLKKKRSTSGLDSVPDDASYMDSPQVNGLAPANPKRNIEFHALFRSVPEDDYLINDYGCALQKEILVQGRLYVSRNHVCFNANIFGWVTNLVIAFSDIVSIEKKMTAFVIPNAISISTLHAKHFFTSFLSRDTACELLQAMWRKTHPALTFTSFTESECTPNKSTEESGASSESSAESSEEGKSTDVRKKFVLPKISLPQMKFIRGGGAVLSDDERQTQNKHVQNESSTKGRRPRSKSVTELQPSPGSDLPVSETHSRTQSRNSMKSNAKKRRHPTQCACLKNDQHYNNVSMDTTITGTVEKIYNLFFTSEFVNRFISEEEKCFDIDIGEWKTVDSKLTRSSSYIKPLNNTIGPKSTKCYIKDEVLHRDFDNYITSVSTVTTPDVPSGSSFCLKARTCIMWAGPNETRLIVTCAVEWSKSSWLKGTIENACIEGQANHWKDLIQYIKKYIAAHLSEFKDDSTPSVREGAGADSSEVTNERTRKERTRSIATPLEPNSIEQTEPTIVQRQAAGLWNIVFEIPSILYSILTPMIQNISTPSTNTMIILATFLMMIANMYNWLLLRDIGKRLDNVAGGITSITRNRKNDLPYEFRHQHELFSTFDDRIENEGDVLWQWLTEKSRRYEKPSNHRDDDSNEDQTSSPSPFTPDQTDSSSLDGAENNYKSSRDLYEEIGGLHKMLLAAESHAKKLIDVAEYESAYHREQEGKMKKQHETEV